MTSSCRPYVHPSHHFYTRVLLGNLFKFSKPLPNCHHLNQSPWTRAGVKEQTALEEGISCFYNVWGCAGLCQTWVAHLPPIQLLDQGFCVTKKNNGISNHLHCGLSCGRRMKLILGTWNGWYLQAESDLREGNTCKSKSCPTIEGGTSRGSELSVPAAVPAAAALTITSWDIVGQCFLSFTVYWYHLVQMQCVTPGVCPKTMNFYLVKLMLLVHRPTLGNKAAGDLNYPT